MQKFAFYNNAGIIAHDYADQPASQADRQTDIQTATVRLHIQWAHTHSVLFANYLHVEYRFVTNFHF